MSAPEQRYADLGAVDFNAACGPVVPHQAVGEPAAMRPTFREPELQNELERAGCAVVPFLDAAMERSARGVLDRLGTPPGDPCKGWYAGNASHSAAWKLTVANEIRPLVEDQLSSIFDRHRIFNITLMTKWPGRDGQVFVHQDPTMVDEEGRFRGITLWCPLARHNPPTDADRGQIRIARGSHRLETAQWFRARGTGLPTGFEGISALLYERVAQPVATAPGEAVAFDQRVIHCSHPNLTDVPRHVLAIGLRPEEATAVHIDCAGEKVRFYAVDEAYFTETWTDGVRYPLIREVDRQPVPVMRPSDVEPLLPDTGTSTATEVVAPTTRWWGRGRRTGGTFRSVLRPGG